jgi:Wax ester synthase/diacylglycerol acyltransferase catalytic domain
MLATAEQIAMTPFDRARSLWEATLFEGLPNGRAGYLLKTHHSTTDGLGSIQLLSQVHSSTRDPNPGKPQPLPAEPEDTSAADVMTGQLIRNAERLPADAFDVAAAGMRALVNRCAPAVMPRATRRRCGGSSEITAPRAHHCWRHAASPGGGWPSMCRSPICGRQPRPHADPSPDVHLMKAEVGNSTPLTSVLLGSASRDAASRWHTSMIMFQARAISIY